MTNELLPSTAQVLPEDQRGVKPPRRTASVVGALAVGVIAMVVVVVTWVTTRDDSVSDEALFVLPVPNGDWRLSDGTVTEPVADPDAAATDERFIDRGTLYGVADGDGFDGLRSMVHYRESPLAGAEWEPAETPWGGAYRRVDGSMTFALEEYTYEGEWEGSGGGWTVASSPSDLLHAYDMLGNDTFDLVRIAFFAPLDTPRIPTTSFVMTSPEGSMFTVETAAGSPLFAAATFAERIDPVDIAGTAGWAVTDAGEDPSVTVVTWSPETGRTISVRSSARRDAVVDAARRLQPVAADEWASLVPARGSTERRE